jgi:hypothetical protein
MRRWILAAVAGGNIRVSGDPRKKALHLLAALRRYGTSEQLKQKYDAIQEAATINRNLPMNEDDRKRIATSFNELGAYLRRLAASMVMVEAEVVKEGFRVNLETGRVSFKRDGKGRDVIRAEIWDIFEKKYRKRGNIDFVHMHIRKELGRFLPPESLPNGFIYDTIDKGIKRRW